MEVGEVQVVSSRRDVKREPSPDAPPSEDIKVHTPCPMHSTNFLAYSAPLRSASSAEPTVPKPPTSSAASAPARFRHKSSPVATASHSPVDEDDDEVPSDDVGVSGYANDMGEDDTKFEHAHPSIDDDEVHSDAPAHLNAALETNTFDDVTAVDHGPPDVDMPASSPIRSFPFGAARSRTASPASRRSSAQPTAKIPPGDVMRTLSKSPSPVKPAIFATPRRDSLRNSTPNSGPKWTCLSVNRASLEPEDREKDEEEIDELDPD